MLWLLDTLRDAIHGWLTIHLGHAVRIYLRTIAVHLELLDHTLQSLLSSDWAILMRQEKSLQIDDLFPHLGQLLDEIIILSAVQLNLVLQVLQPLLLALSALQCGDPTNILVLDRL